MNRGAPQDSDPYGGYGPLLAVAGILGGGYVAYERGLLKDSIHEVIQLLAKYKPGKSQAILNAFDNLAKHPLWESKNGNYVLRMFGIAKDTPAVFQRAFRDFETKERLELHTSHLLDQDHPLDLHRAAEDLINIHKEAKNLRGNRILGKHVTDEELEKVMINALHKEYRLDEAEQATLMHRTGHRFATVEDVWEKLTSKQQQDINRLKAAANRVNKDMNVMKWKIDNNVMINKDMHVSDIRQFRHTFGRFVDSFANEYGIPMVHFNPVKLFYLDQLTTMRKTPHFVIHLPDERQPLVTKNNEFLQRPLFWAMGDVHDLGTKSMEKIAENTRLVSAKDGTIARLIRNMAGIPIKTFKRPAKGFWNKFRYDVADLLDLGFQDEPIRRYRDDMHNEIGVDLAAGLGDAFSWGADKFWKKFPLVPRGSVHTDMEFLDRAFGQNTRWLIMNNYKPLVKSNSFKEYIDQFFASRKQLDQVTTGSLFGYAFFERLNAALNSAGLGLSTRNMGSGFDIAKNLIFRRMVPLAVGIEALKYGDYVSGLIMGEPFSHKVADFFQGASVDVAYARDALGVTDVAKSWAGVFPGSEFITEFPGLSTAFQFFQPDHDVDETKKYWDDGSDPVRKGRWWDLGNTPFIGGQIEYFRPNWARRAKADVEYSDSKYGSADEYWAHTWLPTPTNPLAPIRHFLTDPYWFERKHYQDRPYLLSGGIPELEDFPIIGTLLNDTIGQILKPQKQMHEDWRVEQAQEDKIKYSRNSVDTIIPAVVDPANYSGFFGTASSMAGTLGVNVSAPYQPKGGGYMGAPVSVSGTGGPPNANIDGLTIQPEGDQIVYTTASGATQVMQLAPGVSTYDINQKIKENGIRRTGDVKEVHPEDADPDVAGMFAPAADPYNPTVGQMLVGNLHYNLAELGGFYGFASNMMTGELYDQAGVVQTSSRATGYERAFWDQDIGGLGGEANEIFRRFLPHRRRQIDEYNPIRNQMPSWMPGSDYYIDFQHGDPYVKVKNGEERLPGEGYERLYGINDPMKMSIGASYIGKSQDEIINHLLKRKELDMEDSEDVLTYGEKVHKKIQKTLDQNGVMIDYEQKVEDKGLAVKGFYDGKVDTMKFLNWAEENGMNPKINAEGQPVTAASILEIKTMSDKKFHSGEIDPAHLAQMNFYMHETGLNFGFLMYANRDNPDDTPIVRGFKYDDDLYKKSIENLQGARKTIRHMINNGIIGPADMYDIVDRFRILADVAPYSNEFRDLRDEIGKLDLSDEQKKEIREIRHQVAERKKFTLMTPYKFATADVQQERVHVTKVVDSNSFLTKEYPNNPIKMAGIRVPVGKDDPIAQQARELISGYIHEGASINIMVDADELRRENNDTYHTINAVVAAGPLRNLNHELLRKGLAKERDTDDSATGIYARYTPVQRAVGTLWEKIGHLDTIFNTKFLQLRSPYESYERREVFGKDWQDWEHPIDSYLKPAWDQVIHGGPLVGTLTGAVAGYLIGRNRRARLIAGTLGALVGFLGGEYGLQYKNWTGHTWIPERRKKEWDLNEYMDTLHYLKDTKLFGKYAELSKRKEGFDVASYIKRNHREGEKRKTERRELEKLKRELRDAVTESQRHPIRRQMRQVLHYTGPNGPNDKDLLRALNARINEIANTRDIRRLGPYSSKALLYYQDSERTMYGFEPGEDIDHLMSALPKKDREYILPFMEAPKAERQKILDTTPDYIRRALEATWGMPVEAKPDLPSYFTKHQLPDANWIGWDERVSLDDVKVKIVKHEAMDASEFDIWPDQQQRADREYIPTPKLHDQSTLQGIQQKLMHVLGKSGIENLDVIVEPTSTGRIDVNLDIQKDRRDDIRRQLNENGSALFGNRDFS